MKTRLCEFMFRATLVVAQMATLLACGSESSQAPEATPAVKSVEVAAPSKTEAVVSVIEEKATKLTSSNCTDPSLAEVKKGTTFMLCDGTIGVGTMEPITTVVTVTGETAQPDLSNLVAANIRSGIIINSVTGTLVQTDAPALCDNNAQIGCVTSASWKSASLTNLADTNIRSGVSIAGTMGTMLEESHSNCDGNAQTGCVTTATWKSADFTYLYASNIRSGATVAGVLGSLVPSPDNCTGNSQTGCVTTALWKSADLTNLSAANVAYGVGLAGVVGSLRVPAAADVRAGFVYGAYTGSLKASCRNGTYMAGGTINIDDKIATALGERATFAFSDWGTNSLCYNGFTVINENTQQDVKSLLTVYVPDEATVIQSSAKTYCENLSYLDHEDWRLPTQKELMQLYVNGFGYSFPGLSGGVFWSSTTYSANLAASWYVDVVGGSTSASTGGSYSIMCVR